MCPMNAWLFTIHPQSAHSETSNSVADGLWSNLGHSGFKTHPQPFKRGRLGPFVDGLCRCQWVPSSRDRPKIRTTQPSW
jgi:hypothetical protein